MVVPKRQGWVRRVVDERNVVRETACLWDTTPCRMTGDTTTGRMTGDTSPCSMTRVTLHGVVSPDTPCRMTRVTLHGVVSPNSRQGAVWRPEGSGCQGSGVRGQGSVVRGPGSGVQGQGAGVRGQGSGVSGQGDGFVSHKVFSKSFCRVHLPHKSVNLSFTIANIKTKWTDL